MEHHRGKMSTRNSNALHTGPRIFHCLQLGRHINEHKEFWGWENTSPLISRYLSIASTTFLPILRQPCKQAKLRYNSTIFFLPSNDLIMHTSYDDVRFERCVHQHFYPHQYNTLHLQNMPHKIHIIYEYHFGA